MRVEGGGLRVWGVGCRLKGVGLRISAPDILYCWVAVCMSWTVISFFVSVPVLSEQITVTDLRCGMGFRFQGPGFRT